MSAAGGPLLGTGSIGTASATPTDEQITAAAKAVYAVWLAKGDVDAMIFGATTPQTSRIRSAERDEIADYSYKVERAKSKEPCIRCGAINVGFYVKQTRSGDEGQTTFHDCGDCGATWVTY